MLASNRHKYLRIMPGSNVIPAARLPMETSFPLPHLPVSGFISSRAVTAEAAPPLVKLPTSTRLGYSLVAALSRPPSPLATGGDGVIRGDLPAGLSQADRAHRSPHRPQTLILPVMRGNCCDKHQCLSCRTGALELANQTWDAVWAVNAALSCET